MHIFQYVPFGAGWVLPPQEQLTAQAGARRLLVPGAGGVVCGRGPLSEGRYAPSGPLWVVYLSPADKYHRFTRRPP